MKRRLRTILLSACLALPMLGLTQQVSPPVSPPGKSSEADFLKAADEVLADVSRIIELPMKSELRKSIRSREQIRAFVVSEMERDREPQKWRADQLALEMFGLLPRGLALRHFLAELLTEQIAGLYNPKEKEFFIADWISLADQRMVMAHELVHALQDQHFDVEQWMKAARPNDDAGLARHAVLEGSAIAGMLDYLFRESKMSVRDLPVGLGDFMQQQMATGTSSPELAKAPLYIREVLLFPYTAGANFSQRLLKESGGWADFYRVFQRPPASSQQILHPEIYLNGVEMKRVTLPEGSKFLGKGWRTLDENVMGELGTHLLLKQFRGQERAALISSAWSGDLYGVYEHEASGRTALSFRLRLDTAESAVRFFGMYSETLELKHEKRTQLFRCPNFFSFETAPGGVFLYCVANECLTLEGVDRGTFDRLIAAVRWPAAPNAPERKPVTKTAQLQSAVSSNALQAAHR